MPRVHGIDLAPRRGRGSGRRRPGFAVGGFGAGGEGALRNGDGSGLGINDNNDIDNNGGVGTNAREDNDATTTNGSHGGSTENPQENDKNNDTSEINDHSEDQKMGEKLSLSKSDSAQLLSKRTTTLEASSISQSSAAITTKPSHGPDNLSPALKTMTIQPQSKEYLHNLEFSSNSFSVPVISHRSLSIPPPQSYPSLIHHGNLQSCPEELEEAQSSAVVRVSNNYESNAINALERSVEYIRKQSSKQRAGTSTDASPNRNATNLNEKNNTTFNSETLTSETQAGQSNKCEQSVSSSTLLPNPPSFDSEHQEHHPDNGHSPNSTAFDSMDDWNNLPVESMVNSLVRALRVGDETNGSNNNSTLSSVTHLPLAQTAVPSASVGGTGTQSSPSKPSIEFIEQKQHEDSTQHSSQTTDTPHSTKGNNGNAPGIVTPHQHKSKDPLLATPFHHPSNPPSSKEDTILRATNDVIGDVVGDVIGRIASNELQDDSADKRVSASANLHCEQGSETVSVACADGWKRPRSRHKKRSKGNDKRPESHTSNNENEENKSSSSNHATDLSHDNNDDANDDANSNAYSNRMGNIEKTSNSQNADNFLTATPDFPTQDGNFDLKEDETSKWLSSTQNMSKSDKSIIQHASLHLQQLKKTDGDNVVGNEKDVEMDIGGNCNGNDSNDCQTECNVHSEEFDKNNTNRLAEVQTSVDEIEEEKIPHFTVEGREPHETENATDNDNNSNTDVSLCHAMNSGMEQPSSKEEMYRGDNVELKLIDGISRETESKKSYNEHGDSGDVWHDAKDELSPKKTREVMDEDKLKRLSATIWMEERPFHVERSGNRNKIQSEITPRDDPATSHHRSKRKKEPVRIIFTGISATSRHKGMIDSLGAELVESLEEASTATHVIASDGNSMLRRTPKLMICLSKVSKILSAEWLEQSYIKQQFLNTNDFLLLQDKQAEAKYNFSMKETIRNGKLARLEKGGVLGGWAIYICSGVAGNKAPSIRELTLIIESAGGKVLESLSEALIPARSIVLTSDPSTKAQRKEYGLERVTSLGMKIVTTSWLFHSVISQNLSDMATPRHVAKKHDDSICSTLKDERSGVYSNIGAGNNIGIFTTKRGKESPHASELARCDSDESLSSTRGKAGDLRRAPCRANKRIHSGVSCHGKNTRGSRVSHVEYADSLLPSPLKLFSPQRTDRQKSVQQCQRCTSREQFLSSYEMSPTKVAVESSGDTAASDVHLLWLQYYNVFNKQPTSSSISLPDASTSNPTSKSTSKLPTISSTGRPKSARGVRCRRGRKRSLSPMSVPLPPKKLTSNNTETPRNRKKEASLTSTHTIPKSLVEQNPYVSWESYVLFQLGARAHVLGSHQSLTSGETVQATSFFPLPTVIKSSETVEKNVASTSKDNSTTLHLFVNVNSKSPLLHDMAPASSWKSKIQGEQQDGIQVFGTLQDVFSLHQQYQTSGMIPEQVLAQLALQAIDAVAAMHACGVVHNNIGLGSFLVTKRVYSSETMASQRESDNSPWFLQLIGFGDKSVVLGCHERLSTGEGTHMSQRKHCEDDHYENDYRCLANMFHILLTGGIEMSLSTKTNGLVDFEARPFIKGNLFLRGALAWCTIIDALLGIGDCYKEENALSQNSEAPFRLQHIIRNSHNPSLSAADPGSRISQMGWSCHALRDILSQRGILAEFLDELFVHIPPNNSLPSLFECSASTHSYSSTYDKQSDALLSASHNKCLSAFSTKQEELKLELVQKEAKLELKAMDLVQRESEFHNQCTKFEQAKLDFEQKEIKYQSVLRREEEARMKETKLFQKEQALIMEAKHLQRIQQEILARERHLEQRSRMLEKPRAPAQMDKRLPMQVNSTHPSSKMHSPSSSAARSDHLRRHSRQHRPYQSSTSDVSDSSPEIDETDLTLEAPKYRGKKNISGSKPIRSSPNSTEHICSLQNLAHVEVGHRQILKTPGRSSQGKLSTSSNSRKSNKRKASGSPNDSNSPAGSRSRFECDRLSPQTNTPRKMPKKVFIRFEEDSDDD